jgi:protease I
VSDGNLDGLKVAILITDGFEQVEMTEPRKALDAAGAETSIVSPKGERVRAWKFTEWGDEFPVDVPLDGARPEDFDALLLPGGVINPDTLRMRPAAVAFAKAFLDAGKPVATICHGPWTVIEAGAARGRGWRPGRRSRPTSRTPARSGSNRRPWSTATSCRAASPTTSRPSTRR